MKSIIKNSFGEKLVGILHTAAKSNKLVVVCHGRVCTKEEHFYPELCERLTDNGFNSFRFDFSGNGESEGKFEDSSITKDIKDIKSVVDYFKKKGFRIFCLAGHSQGAVEVLLHQAKYKSAECVVDIAAYADQREATIKKYPKEKIKELNEKGYIMLNAWNKIFKLTKKYFYDRASYGDIRKKVRKIKVPILVVHGTDDRDVDFSNGLKMKRALIEDGAFLPIEGADHFFKDKIYKGILISSIIRWLKVIK